MNKTVQCIIALTCSFMILACSTTAAITPTLAPTAAPTAAPTVTPTPLPTMTPTTTRPAATATASATPTKPAPAATATSTTAPRATATSTAPAAKPDLYISEFTLSPNPPLKGQSVHVRIGVYNGGGTAAGPFKVRWLAGVTFATQPPCAWDVDSLAARGGRILECDAVAYQSTYGSLVTRAQADVEDKVAESNEDNNARDLTIKVDAPPSAAKPDLYVSEFQLTPNPPDHTKSVHVRLGVYNKGDAAATVPFKVEWWAGSNYPGPACTWTVDSMSAKGGRILECDKAASTWASGYAKITTQVKVDTGNAVAESDEGNNVHSVEIAVK